VATAPDLRAGASLLLLRLKRSSISCPPVGQHEGSTSRFGPNAAAA
jgi:hypothetical protein